MGRSVDLAGVKTEFPTVEPGSYLCTITKGEYREAGSQKAKNAKHDVEAVELTIDRNIETDDDEFSGQKLFKNFSLGPESLWSFKRFCIAAGVDPDDLEGSIDPEEIVVGLIGTSVVAVTDTREWQDRTLADVKDIKSVDEF